MLISPSTVQSDISTPTVISWNLKIEQQVTSNTAVTVAYVGSHGYHQIMSGDLNAGVRDLSRSSVPGLACCRHYLLPHHHQG